jgi:CheY-like chemotaxis protein
MRTSAVPGIAGATHTVTCSAGIASVPDVAAELGALHAAADSAFLLAGAHVIDDVFSASRVHGDQAQSRVDVLLVDDDPATASLVIHALEARRYSVRWIRDGAEAATALAGDKPLISARVVLMEVNLSTLDGLSVLRALAAAQSLRRTRVVMLSQRTSEAETLQAFELGAFDYVAKPFSVAVLAERVRRALVA